MSTITGKYYDVLGWVLRHDTSCRVLFGTGFTPPGTSFANCISSPLSFPPRPESTIRPSLLEVGLQRAMCCRVFNAVFFGLSCVCWNIHQDKVLGKDERALCEVQLQRLKVMDEICEMLAEIPAAEITSLFGLSAPFIQKKLALR